MNQIRMTLAALVCCIMAAQAQTEEFTVATLNVDGLPQKLIIPVNPDGPGEKYTPEIADFLLNKKYDIIGIQENFNYYDYLFPKLDAAGYSHDRCYSKIELENFRYPYPNDGINAIWRKGIKGERADSVAWTESYGIISHANDGLTNKGFRRYELTLVSLKSKGSTEESLFTSSIWQLHHLILTLKSMRIPLKKACPCVD